MTDPAAPAAAKFPLPIPRAAWVLLALLVLSGTGYLLGLAGAILLLAGLALALAVFLGYSSLIALAGESELSLDEALTLVAPSAEEEQKRAVLRALKDLEYERAIGKISPADYDELVARYRGEAKRLLQLVAEIRGDQLARAERRIVERLVAAGLLEATVPSPSAAPPAGASRGRPQRARAPRPRCPKCGQRATRDARFCKACGTTLEAEPTAVAAVPVAEEGER